MVSFEIFPFKRRDVIQKFHKYLFQFFKRTSFFENQLKSALKGPLSETIFDN